MNRRSFFNTLSAGAAAGALAPTMTTQPPNVIVMLADDLGYGDLGCYGSGIRTPNIDRMATQGVRLRQFCSASAVCSPSRAALLTGRYGVRGGIPHVLGPRERVGLSLGETTMAQTLKSAGYRTMCVGKWHLGAFSPYLPTERGFDEYYGIPYSNDNAPSILMRNTDVIEAPVELATITQRYTQQATKFIRDSKDAPFFLYLPYNSPHIPLEASVEFRGRSPMGPYGDAVQELDWSVGQVLSELEAQGIAQNTLVLFTSDNGPWFEGSPGRLRGRKGDTFEGGMRVPFLASYPGHFPEGRTIRSFASMLDLFPTIASVAAAPLPRNPMDGVNIWPVLAGESEAVERPPFLYLDGYNLQCARLGRWKLHMSRYNGPAFAPPPDGGRVNLPLLLPELYDMETGAEECYNTASQNPVIVSDILARVQEILPTLPAAVQSAWSDTTSRPAAYVNAGEWPSPKR